MLMIEWPKMLYVTKTTYWLFVWSFKWFIDIKSCEILEGTLRIPSKCPPWKIKMAQQCLPNFWGCQGEMLLCTCWDSIPSKYIKAFTPWQLWAGLVWPYMQIFLPKLLRFGGTTPSCSECCKYLEQGGCPSPSNWIWLKKYTRSGHTGQQLWAA